jgi:aquaporin Z
LGEVKVSPHKNRPRYRQEFPNESAPLKPRPVPIAQRLGAEALGTFFIAATAIGVDIFYYTQGNVDYASRWLARGLVTSAVIYAFAETSGAHVDPAVTVGFLLRRVFPAGLAAGYVVAQFAGAFVAAAMWLLLVGPATLALGASHPGPHVSALVATLTEVIATFALVLVILMTAQEEAAIGKQAALAVGFMVAACGFAAGPLSGASMNPARSIAPQILVGAFSNIWIYAVGPIAGAAFAVGVHALLSGAPSKGEKKTARGRVQ